MFLKGEARLASVSFTSQERTEDDGREGHSEKEIQSQWHSEPAFKPIQVRSSHLGTEIKRHLTPAL